jgi:hypothetical protein
MLRTVAVCTAAVAALATALSASAGTVSFDLVTHPTNEGLLPQLQEDGGDHLLQTPDDRTGDTYNPDGCWSFNFMNPQGIDPSSGYAEGIHSMRGSLSLDVDLAAGGAVGIQTLHFEGYVAPGKLIAHQRVVNPDDDATDGKHGEEVDGAPNSGTYAASALSNWALAATFDWYYDTPFAGAGTIDMTFNDYVWTGFIIPTSELTAAGMDATVLDDPLGYFGGTSADFEAWLLAEVALLLPGTATHLLFAQGEAHPDWTNPKMGMTTEGIVGATIIATMPEPSSLLLLACGAILASRARRRLART